MPELPEVEHLRRTLEPCLLGATIRHAHLHRADFAWVHGSDRPASPRDLLQGATITELRRRGKHLAIIAKDGRTLDVHLGMSGQVIHDACDDAAVAAPHRTHVHARWTLERNGSPAGEVLFRDPRRFGGLVAVESVNALEHDLWRNLGPDALSITAAQLSRNLTGSRRAIKPALLDQGVLAGVGNIYADEALFFSGIRPTRRCSRLTRAEITRLAASIRRVLTRSIRSGGSTLRDYVDARGSRGSFQDLHAVYGRAGKPCRRCGRSLRSIVLGQRTTVFCTSCQK